MEFLQANTEDAAALAEIRAAAMKPSLEAVGRFDEDRVRSRFLEGFVPSETFKLVVSGVLVGFYVLRDKGDHCYLDHLYIAPKYQNKQYGKTVVARVVQEASGRGLPLRLGALRGSKSNDFYLQNGFSKTHEDEFDIYYEYGRAH